MLLDSLSLVSVTSGCHRHPTHTPLPFLPSIPPSSLPSHSSLPSSRVAQQRLLSGTPSALTTSSR